MNKSLQQLTNGNIMTNQQIKPLAGNTVADLVAYLLQLPQDYTVKIPADTTSITSYYNSTTHELIEEWYILLHEELKTVFLGDTT